MWVKTELPLEQRLGRQMLFDEICLSIYCLLGEDLAHVGTPSVLGIGNLVPNGSNFISKYTERDDTNHAMKLFLGCK